MHALDFPFVDIRDAFNKNVFVRTFKEDVKLDKLIWHKDKKDREFMVLSGMGWKFQKDNELPIDLEPGNVYHINKEVYHRLLKGDSDLTLEIREYE